jgi:streptogramin lyase
MREKKFWGPSRSGGVRMGLVVRIGLVLLATVGSALLAWNLVGSHYGAHATGVNEYQTTENPWGVAFDNSGHIWVAEPACDASPVCGTPPQGIIAEYTMANGNKVSDYQSASAAIFTPVFLVLDGSGNVWFTDPTHNAIGELIPGSNTWTEWTAPTANAAPYDLVMDGSGKIWFTEIQAGKIGFFNPSTHTFVETAIPTASSSPYGITIAPNGDIWFAENAQPKIGSFTPIANGTISIAEHVIETVANPPTAHLITSDSLGNIWYSEGFANQVGKYVPSSNTHTDFNVSNNTCPVPGTPLPNCSVHISGISIDGTGMVWFTDSLNARVGFVNPANGVSTWVTLSNPNAHPHDGLAVDGSNNAWFTEQNGFKVGDVPAGSLSGGTPTASPSPSVSPTGTPSLPPGPVNKTWYFAEGRVGAGFQEYLTLGNPDPANSCQVNIQYLYTPDGGSAKTKNVPITVPAASRHTESVNGDLSISPTQTPAASLAAIVTVGAGACNGIVAERPMYYQWHGIDSGSDVLGLTHTGTTWNFGDIPTGGGYSSFITILNPGATAANVTATYYAGGNLVKSQNLQVAAGTRGTISPNGFGLPQHVAAVITSDQPVVVERPAYFSNISGGNAGTVSGGADVVGVQALANDWLFAEGYTGSGFQENLVISNVDTVANTTASVTINLEYGNGTKTPFLVTVAPKSQVIWNVNSAGGPTHEVSAEVTSTGAKILVERQMFFQYHHTVNGITTLAKGGSDVIGQVGPGAHASYSFAEGYTNKGYNEWLVLQNPTATAETIYVTLVNSKGHTYTPPGYVVPAHSRYTIDITAVVVQHLVQPGDNYQGYEVSMTVQTLNNSFFVAERPMYWNTSGISSFATQGGSDIIGYVGG